MPSSALSNLADAAKGPTNAEDPCVRAISMNDVVSCRVLPLHWSLLDRRDTAAKARMRGGLHWEKLASGAASAGSLWT
jgi:hypothetical protein